MSLCDSCFAPGQCCKGLALNIGTIWDHDDPVAFLKLASAEPLPFLPAKKVRTYTAGEDSPHAGATYSTWTWSCPVLAADGRCGDYENRPNVCRIFEPGSDPLCVHWRGAEGGEPWVDATGRPW